MTIDAASLPPTHAPPQPSAIAWNRRDRIVGWLLLVLWTGLVAASLLLGSRESTYAELEARVAAGEVDRVEVAGEHLPSDATGYSSLELSWRRDGIRRTAWVTEASNGRQAEEARQGDRERAVVVGDVRERLRALDPDVGFHRGDFTSTTFMLGGMHAPGWIGLGWLGLVLACLFVAGGPRPWRATPWAWAWLVLLVPPYGVLAFLVLGGPLGLFPPREPRRVWLTGGWAFLLAGLLAGATNGA